jgi:hypothetical protein
VKFVCTGIFHACFYRYLLEELWAVTPCRIEVSDENSTFCVATCFMLISCLDYSSDMKMKVTYFSETSVDIQRTTRRYTQEDRTRHNHRCEIFKFYTEVSDFSKETYCLYLQSWRVNLATKRTNKNAGLAYWIYTSTLKLEAKRSSETLVDSYHHTWCRIQDERRFLGVNSYFLKLLSILSRFRVVTIRRGLDRTIVFIGTLYTRLRITINYSAISEPHT